MSTNDNSNALIMGVDVPTLGQRLLKAFAQKGLTTVAAALVTHGVITSGQQSGFVEIGLSIALYLAGSVWTYLHEKHGNDRLVSALTSPTTTVVKPQ